MNDCVICYTIQEACLTCEECKSVCCQECSERWFKICKTNKTIPKCPNCNQKFLINSVKILKNKKITEYYLESCYNFLMTDYESRVNDEILFRHQLETLRKERIKFVEEKLPKAIKAIIDISLSSKLKKINKERQKQISEMIENGLNRYCMLLTCDGKLETIDEQRYRCIKCDTEFCQKCESFLKPGHVCKQDDLDSMKMINNFTKCPKCGVHVERSEGCPSITCSNCNTNFDYNTGERRGHGSNKEVKMKTIYLLSHELSQLNCDSKIIEFIQKLESNKPSLTNQDNVIKYLILVKQEPERRQELLLKIAKFIEKYTLNKIKYKKYNNIMLTIEKLHLDKKLDFDKLTNLVLT